MFFTAEAVAARSSYRKKKYTKQKNVQDKKLNKKTCAPKLPRSEFYMPILSPSRDEIWGGVRIEQYNEKDITTKV